MSPRLSRRTGIIAVSVVVVGALVAALIVVLAGGDSEERAKDRPTAWNMLLRRSTNEGVTKQLALDAYATMIGPIPGGRAVEAPDLGTTSSSPAVRWLGGYWADLSSAQRATVRTQVFGAGNGAAGSARGRAAGPVAAPPDPLRPELVRLVNRVAAGMAARYSDDTYTLKFLPLTVSTSDDVYTRVPDAWATASASRDTDEGEDLTASADAESCKIKFWRPFLERYRSLPRPRQDKQILTAVAHELYHCHQYLVAGADRDRQSWISEGSATWAALKYAYGEAAETEGSGWWEAYFDPMPPKESKLLFKRSYDALGFYAQMEETLGFAPWPRIDQMLKLSNIPAFRAASQVTTETFLADWARGFVGDRRAGPEWETIGPARGSYRPPPPRMRALGQRMSTRIRNPEVVTARFRLGSSAEAVRVKVKGYGGLLWRGSSKPTPELVEAPQEKTLWYCLQPEQCSCTATGRPDAKELTVALTGGLDSSHFKAEATTGAELCEQGGAIGGTYEGPLPDTRIHVRVADAGDGAYTVTMTNFSSHGRSAQGCQQDYGPPTDPAEARVRPEGSKFHGTAISVNVHGKRCFYQAHEVVLEVVDSNTVKLCDPALGPTCPSYRRTGPDATPTP
ncbi:hypothetical protein [Streptomyces roseifaciens]|uniref:hypothetical protein n=1 Tax=Streptomyces roseifaciens TaxID=1488406 RepID=UPI0007180781|nr:hypothetical protein [Streptomyces roseifaciens]